MNMESFLKYYRRFVEARKQAFPGFTIGFFIGLVSALAFYMAVTHHVKKWQEEEKKIIETKEAISATGNGGGNDLNENDDQREKQEQETEQVITTAAREINYNVESSQLDTTRTEPIAGMLPYWSLSMVLLVLCGASGYRYYKVVDLKADEALRTDDPPDVKEAVRHHMNEILVLGTPRKIKRFLNKVRFQYSMMDKEKLTANSELDFLRYFRYILIHEGYKHLGKIDDDLLPNRIQFLYEEVFESQRLTFGELPKDFGENMINEIELPGDLTTITFWKYNDFVII